MNTDDFLTEDEIWDEVMGNWFPNAETLDEIEDELESWLKD